MESVLWQLICLDEGFKAKRGLPTMPKQVMIVEDNELNMKLFRDLIEASGYTTIQTRNGMEALDLSLIQI